MRASGLPGLRILSAVPSAEKLVSEAEPRVMSDGVNGALGCGSEACAPEISVRRRTSAFIMGQERQISVKKSISIDCQDIPAVPWILSRVMKNPDRKCGRGSSRNNRRN